MCFFDEAFAWDRNDLDLQRKLGAKTNLTLAGMAPCQDLVRIRESAIPHLARYGYVKSPLPSIDNKPLAGSRGEFIKEVCGLVGQQAAGTLKESVDRLNVQMREMMPNAKLGQPTNVGIGYRERDMCAMVSTVRVSRAKDEVVRVAVIGFTLVNGIPLTVNLYGDYEGDATLPRLVEESKAALTALVKANPGR